MLALALCHVPLALLAAQDAGADVPREPPPLFRDVSDQSGIRSGNCAADPPEGTRINDHSRLALADLDGDGRDDAVMHSLYPNARSGVPFEHLVFLNQGSLRFRDVSDASGLRGVQAGFFAFGDVDDDGDQDVFAGLDIDGYGDHTSTLWRNDGAAHFARVEGSGVEDAPYSWAACAAFADFDGDADLDLYVGNGGTARGAADFLYLGRGDGRFEDASARLVDAPEQPSNGVVTCDWDDDGDLDVFVSTYGVSVANGHNHLWRNDGRARFAEVGLAHGFACLATGNSWLEETGHGRAAEPGELAGCVGSNGFGIDCGDVDGDGDLDVLLAAISHPDAGTHSRKWSDPSQLLLNGGAAGGHGLTNVWLDRGLPYNEGDVDAALVDFDNDGRLDVSLSRERKYEGRYTSREQKAWFGLMRQRADGSFESVGYASGINDPQEALLRMKGAQNHVWSDLDGDGDLDLLVGGRDQGGGRPNFLFENLVGQDRGWLSVRVEGDGEKVTRDAIGARAWLRSAGRTQLREKKSSRGTYNSEDTRALHFGLGGDAPLELRVRWPDGTEARFDAEALGRDRRLRVRYPDRIEAL